jgi:hypothetical protein
MKTERRHELQTNWLADRMGELILVTKPYLKGVVGVLLAALVLWCTYLFLAHRADAEAASGWTSLWQGLLGGPTATEQLQTLSDTSPKRPTGEWAQLILSDNALTNGVNSLFTDKTAGRSQINIALDGYRTVLTNSTDPLAREHALFGVGRAEESLCKLDDAQRAYEQLRKEYPTGAYAARAKDRLDDLARDSTRARYDWFAKLEPAPNVFGKGTETTGDKGAIPPLPPELEPFAHPDFTPSPSKTPPPEPKPDKGATGTKEAPKESPKDLKSSDTKAPDTKSADTKASDTKASDTKAPDSKTPEKSKTDDKAVEPKSSDTKSTDAKSTDSKTTTDSKSTDTKSSDTKPDDSKNTPPKASDSK